MVLGIESAIRGAIAFILGAIANAIKGVMTTLIEGALIPMITTSPVPRGHANMPMLKVPFESASKCGNVYSNGMAEAQCRMWSEVYHGVYKFGATDADVGVLTMAILLLVISFVAMKTMEAVGLFDKSSTMKRSSSTNTITERFTYAFMGIMLWWPIGTGILYFTDIFAGVLAATSGFGSLQVNIVSGGIAAAVTGIIVYTIGTLLILAVVLFWAIRFILLIVLMTTMPILFSMWTLDAGPFDAIADTASTLMELFVLLAFAPIPAGLVLFTGGVVSSITAALPGGNIMQVIAYAVFPFIAGAMPYFMFKDQVASELSSSLGDQIGEVFEEMTDPDALQQRSRQVGAGAKSAIEGEYYAYDEEEGEYTQVGKDEAGIAGRLGRGTRATSGTVRDAGAQLSQRGSQAGRTATLGAADAMYNREDFERAARDRLSAKKDELSERDLKKDLVESVENSTAKAKQRASAKAQSMRERDDSALANVAGVAAGEAGSAAKSTSSGIEAVATTNPLDEMNQAVTGVNKQLSEIKQGQMTVPLQLLDDDVEAALKDGERDEVRGRMDDIRAAIRTGDPEEVQKAIKRHTGKEISQSTASGMIETASSETYATWAPGEEMKKYGDALDAFEGRATPSEEIAVGGSDDSVDMESFDAMGAFSTQVGGETVSTSETTMSMDAMTDVKRAAAKEEIEEVTGRDASSIDDLDEFISQSDKFDANGVDDLNISKSRERKYERKAEQMKSVIAALENTDATELDDPSLRRAVAEFESADVLGAMAEEVTGVDKNNIRDKMGNEIENNMDTEELAQTINEQKEDVAYKMMFRGMVDEDEQNSVLSEVGASDLDDADTDQLKEAVASSLGEQYTEGMEDLFEQAELSETDLNDVLGDGDGGFDEAAIESLSGDVSELTAMFDNETAQKELQDTINNIALSAHTETAKKAIAALENADANEIDDFGQKSAVTRFQELAEDADIAVDTSDVEDASLDDVASEISEMSQDEIEQLGAAIAAGSEDDMQNALKMLSVGGDGGKTRWEDEDAE